MATSAIRCEADEDALYRACYEAAAGARALWFLSRGCSAYLDSRSHDALEILEASFQDLTMEELEKIGAVPPLLSWTRPRAWLHGERMIYQSKTHLPMLYGLSDVHRLGTGLAVPLSGKDRLRLTPGMEGLVPFLERLHERFSTEDMSELWKCRRTLQIGLSSYLRRSGALVTRLGGTAMAWDGDGLFFTVPVGADLRSLAWEMQNLELGFLSSLSIVETDGAAPSQDLRMLDVGQCVMKACAGGPLDWGVLFRYPTILKPAQVMYMNWRISTDRHIEDMVRKSVCKSEALWERLLPMNMSLASLCD
jgi:hypothetical protein